MSHLTDCNLNPLALVAAESSPVSSVAGSGCSNRQQWLEISLFLDKLPLRDLTLHARWIAQLEAKRAGADAQAKRAAAHDCAGAA